MDKVKTDEESGKWDTGEHWDIGHDGHPTHHWESEHRYEGKPPSPKKLYMVNKQRKHRGDSDESLADEGTYLVVWGSVLRDLTGLLLEGVGLVILGHFVPIATIMMLVGISLGVFALHRKFRKRR